MLSFQASNGTTAVLSIKEMSKEATHHARTYELSHIAVLLAVIALNLILGFIYRILLIKNVHQTGWFTRPINIMTVIDETVKFIGKDSFKHWTEMCILWAI